MKENDGKVVNLFGNEQQEEVSPEQQEVDSKMEQMFKEQNELIRKMVVESYKKVDEVIAQENISQTLVHIPIEASFSLASTYISVAGNKTEEEAKKMYPLVQELSQAIDGAVDEFFEKNGNDLPNEIMYYALLNVAVNVLQHERHMYNFTQITGESPFSGGTN